ncbi:hypothetical protein [Pararhizobium mangrovi]|uniref:Uncharacterized protein n=1 Tax=Pararhizobium mangrovi TaxID=2590452 RepID=A0A506UHH1_9HYPH|nr:hypothetical protein [Pararhizobium mangrovi]TPW32767.1 hypothetical protein FJU11_00645 [Pararhizobium mangrovi]
MSATKPWYLSRTLWGAAIAVAACLAGLAGIDVSAADQSTIVNQILQIAGAGGGLVAVVGRVAAKTELF